MTRKRESERWTAGTAGAFALAFLAAFAVLAAKNPLIADEVDFFGCIENTRVHGRVLYYAGEVDYSRKPLLALGGEELGSHSLRVYEFDSALRVHKGNRFALEGSSRYTYCLWHPPLYIEALALVTRVLPPTVDEAWKLRFANLPFVALLVAAMWFLARRLRPAEPIRLFFSSLLVLFASPLFLRGSLLIDNGGSLAPASAAIFLLANARAERRVSPLSVAGFALLWASSFGLAVAMTLSTLLATLLARDTKEFLRATLHAVLGFAVFSGGFYFWAKARHFSFAEPYAYNFLARASSASALNVLGSLRLLWSYWVASGVALCAAFLLLAVRFWRRAPVKYDLRLLLGTSVVVAFAMHAFLRADAYGFPKYVVYALPPLALFVAGEALEMFERGAEKLLWARKGALAAVLLEGAVRTGLLLADGRPSLYVAGLRGFEDIVAFVAGNSASREVVIAPKDVAFYAGRRFVSPHLLKTMTPAELRATLDDNRVQLLSAYRGSLRDLDPERARILADELPVAGHIEGFETRQVSRARRAALGPP